MGVRGIRVHIVCFFVLFRFFVRRPADFYAVDVTLKIQAFKKKSFNYTL